MLPWPHSRAQSDDRAVRPHHTLAALAAAFRFRVRLDAEGWPIIPGRLGRLEWHDGARLVVYTDRPRLFARLWALPGVRRWQVGDQEVRGLVPTSTASPRSPL